MKGFPGFLWHQQAPFKDFGRYVESVSKSFALQRGGNLPEGKTTPQWSRDSCHSLASLRTIEIGQVSGFPSETRPLLPAEAAV